MERRYEGHTAPHGLYVLDTFTGEVTFIPHGVTVPSSVHFTRDIFRFLKKFRVFVFFTLTLEKKSKK